MDKIMKYFLIIITIVVFGVIIIFLWQRKNPTSIIGQTIVPILSPTVSKSPILDINEDWKEYVNSNLGFSMWLPKKSAASNDEFLPVNVVEDNKNNVVYVGSGIESSTKDNGWAITVKPIKNDKELDTFIKEKFGSDCKLGKKESLYNFDNINEIYNVEAIPGEKGMESNCPLNFVYKILYNNGRKAMAVAIGQECRFSATLNNYGAICYDDLIINSFRFK